MNFHLTKVSMPYSKTQKVIDGLCFLAIAFMFVYAWSQFDDLPKVIPTSFDLNGRATTFNDKTSLFVLPGGALFAYLCLFYARFDPRIINVPIKITEANAKPVFAIALNMISAVQLIIVALFGSILYQSVAAARDTGNRLMIFPVFVFLGLLFAVIAVSVARMYKIKVVPGPSNQPK